MTEFAKITEFFPFLDHKTTKNDYFNNSFDEQSFKTLGEMLKCSDVLHLIVKFIRIELEKKQRRTMATNFDPIFSRTVQNLESAFEQYENTMIRLQWVFGESEEFKFNPLDFNCTVLAFLPSSIHSQVYEFYDRSFKISTNAQADFVMQDVDQDVTCRYCQNSLCDCQEFIKDFHKTNLLLSKMNLLDRVCGNSITKLIQEKIDNHVNENCTGRYDKSHILSLETWLQSCVLSWLSEIYSLQSPGCKIMENFVIKLNYTLYEAYARCTIDQFFNIIIDFPDSQPALDDLNICLTKLDLRQHLVDTIKKSLATRLLHPGVDTSDILTGYVAAIKTLKYLDKSGALLQTVIGPVKEYLRNRNDTVRCVVASLIDDDGPTDLADELAKSDAVAIEEPDLEDDTLNWENWQPENIETLHKNRSTDIISMVVDIYGSKELFVIEYRNLLAERLLMQLDFNPEKEIRNLELLKLRFGETLLHSCEVMLKDVSDSKRINAHIQSFSVDHSFNLCALILSSQFWPAFRKGTMELPVVFKNEFERYTRQYEGYKGNRTLCWSPLNGKVTIELEFEDRSLEFNVTPTQAVIIHHFEKQQKWRLDDLSNIVNIPPSLLRKRIAFWQTNGVLRETSEGVFELIENQDFEPMHTQADDDEVETAMASSSDQREEELQVFWSYIVGMLTNLDSLPLERIHQMLKMFASQGPGFEFSQEELKNFLQRKVREHELVYSVGVYQLPKI